MTDERRRRREQRHGRRHLGAGLDRRLRRAGADPQGAVTTLDALQLADAPDVDEVLEDGEAERQHRDEALAAREHLRPVAELGEEGHRVGGRVGAWYSNGADFTGAHHSLPIVPSSAVDPAHAIRAVQPPSTGMTAPVTNEARSDARNAATSATSCGWPPRLQRRLLE